jgi:predicted nuclease of predicted toxin-antitoxin system
MVWRRLENPKRISTEFKTKTRLLIDESLGARVAEYLRDRGFNALFVADVGRAGRADEDVFAYAWRKRRMLWTHDRDFLDDNRFPEHRNPGLVVLPGGDGDQVAMRIGIGSALRVFGIAPSIWKRTKSIISSTGEMAIRRRNLDSGKIETKRFRMTGRGYAEYWDERP